MSHDECCPKCGALSAHVSPETVDIGVGEIPIEPDSWTCPTHGNWCYGDKGELLMEYPDAPMPASTSEPCPQCGASSEYQPPATFRSGLLDGEVPVEPSSWWCPTHGRWCRPAPPDPTEESLHVAFERLPG